MNIDKYLYEIVDSYKNANSLEEQNEIFESFCSSIWSNRNKKRTTIKTIRYKVRNDLLETEIGQIFNTWSEIEYISYKSMTKDIDWCSLIRQKINNLYTKYFDGEVILNKDYMNLLKTPYNLYYRWTKGVDINAEELTNIIDNSIYKANKLKDVYAKQKMQMSWNEYKKIIEKFLYKAFNNCKLIDEYEKENLTDKYIYNFITEDNFYVAYICKTLETYLLNYQKEYYGLNRGRNKKYKRCKECGNLIEKTGNRKVYCNECAAMKERERKRKIAYKYRKNKVAN